MICSWYLTNMVWTYAGEGDGYVTEKAQCKRSHLSRTWDLKLMGMAQRVPSVLLLWKYYVQGKWNAAVLIACACRLKTRKRSCILDKIIANRTQWIPMSTVTIDVLILTSEKWLRRHISDYHPWLFQSPSGELRWTSVGCGKAMKTRKGLIKHGLKAWLVFLIDAGACFETQAGEQFDSITNILNVTS